MTISTTAEEYLIPAIGGRSELWAGRGLVFNLWFFMPSEWRLARVGNVGVA